MMLIEYSPKKKMSNYCQNSKSTPAVSLISRRPILFFFFCQNHISFKILPLLNSFSASSLLPQCILFLRILQENPVHGGKIAFSMYGLFSYMHYEVTVYTECTRYTVYTVHKVTVYAVTVQLYAVTVSTVYTVCAVYAVTVYIFTVYTVTQYSYMQ